MTFTEKHEHINGYCIEISREKPNFNVYHISICREYEGSICGYPLKENYTPIRKNALATFNRYKKYAQNA